MQPVLLPVQRLNTKVSRVVHPLDAGNVIVLWQRHTPGTIRRQVVEVQAHKGIVFPRLGVFKPILKGVQELAEQVHGELGHPGLVKPQKSDFVPCRVPFKSPDHRKLLFIHPICHAIDDRILLPVKCELFRIFGLQVE